MYKLHYPEKISRAQAIDKITNHALYGENQNPRPKNKAELEELLNRKFPDSNAFIESCRYYKNPIPELEELGDAVLWDVDKGTTKKIFDKEIGTVINELKGPGRIELYDYSEKFAYVLVEKTGLYKNQEFLIFSPICTGYE